MPARLPRGFLPKIIYFADYLFSQVMGELLKADGAEGDGFWMWWKEILPPPSLCQYFPPGKEQTRDEIRQAGL